MKKLNNKGFTLVELLAVIIILAIVVGISIPAITNVINDSKNNAMGVALDAAEKYLVDQYALMQVDYDASSSNFRTEFQTKIGSNVTITSSAKADLVKEMGLEVDNIKTFTALVRADGTACITVTALDPAKSQYYTTAYWNAAGTTALAGAQNKSKGC